MATQHTNSSTYLHPMSSAKRSPLQASLTPEPEANKVQKTDDSNESSDIENDTSNVSAVTAAVTDVFYNVVG